MTLREMVRELEELDPALLDRRVILAKDGEGNAYSPVPDDAWLGIGNYVPHNV